jgi:large subunit ribosomal protein L25
LRQLEVRALVSAIPHEIVVDITCVTINKGLLAGDIKLPEGVELVTDKEAPVVFLTVQKEDAAAAADAAAQPGSSSTKGKKDAEGNLTKGK